MRTSTSIRETDMETAVSYHLAPVRTAASGTRDERWRECGEREPSCTGAATVETSTEVSRRITEQSSHAIQQPHSGNISKGNKSPVNNSALRRLLTAREQPVFLDG